MQLELNLVITVIGAEHAFGPFVVASSTAWPFIVGRLVKSCQCCECYTLDYYFIYCGEGPISLSISSGAGPASLVAEGRYL